MNIHPRFAPVDPPDTVAPTGRRVVVLVCDGLGVGTAPDAPQLHAGADTLGNVAAAAGGLHLPTLERLGIGHLTDVAGVPAASRPAAAVGRLVPTAAATESTDGHWELFGVVTDRTPATYPHGFDPNLLDAVETAIDRPVIGCGPISGTDVIDLLGRDHLRTGAPIIYTSADSVLQVAVHDQVADVDRLHGWCRTIRALPGCDIGRVIARPFTGEPGAFVRTGGRVDLSLPPPAPTVLEAAHQAGVPVVAVGKIDDLFCSRGIAYSDHTHGNTATLQAVADQLTMPGPALVIANLVDFDQTWGHRNDAAGYADGLAELDRHVAHLLSQLADGDLLVVTGDHGTDPTLAHSTDHTREYVPLLAAGPTVDGAVLADGTMADVGATVAAWLGLPAPNVGRSQLTVQR